MFIRTAIAVVVAATVIQSGTAFAQTAQQPAAPPAATQAHHHRHLALFRGLNLTADQKAQIKSIRQKYRTQNQGITDRNQRRDSMHAQQKEIMAVLTPDQRAKFRQRLQTLRQHRRQNQQAPNGGAPQAQ